MCMYVCYVYVAQFLVYELPVFNLKLYALPVLDSPRKLFFSFSSHPLILYIQPLHSVLVYTMKVECDIIMFCRVPLQSHTTEWNLRKTKALI